MTEIESHSVWIIPEDEEIYSLTSGYIARLSSLYDLPRFEPHVTVLGGVRSPDVAELHRLAESLTPFQIRLAQEVEYQDAYFRCLFLRAYKSDGLMELFSKVSALFDQRDDLYFPHLSLAYGELPVWKKQEMIVELGPIPEIAFEARSISLVHASTEMPVQSWEIVERFPLG